MGEPEDIKEIRIQIGEAIKKDRKRLGLRQIELAKLLSISNNSISNWENGQCSPYIETLAQFVKVLGYKSSIAECVKEIFQGAVCQETVYQKHYDSLIQDAIRTLGQALHRPVKSYTGGVPQYAPIVDRSSEIDKLQLEKEYVEAQVAEQAARIRMLRQDKKDAEVRVIEQAVTIEKLRQKILDMNEKSSQKIKESNFVIRQPSEMEDVLRKILLLVKPDPNDRTVIKLFDKAHATVADALRTRRKL